MAFYHSPASLFIAHWKFHHFPLSPTPRQPLRASLSSALKSSQWPELVLAQGLCDITNRPAQPWCPGWFPVSGCKGRPTHHEPLCPPSLLTMWTLKWFLFFALCLSCGSAFMSSSLREKAREPKEKVPCGGHFRIRQDLSEHVQGWLGSKWLWLFFVVVLYMMLKFRGDSEKEQNNPPALQGCSFRSPTKKNQNASPNKDYAFNTLTQLQMDLVKFMSKVQNLKAAMATGSTLKLQNSEVPADPHNNITIYEIWEEEDSE
ncbi:LOW QUALITY PROTEIN: protein FAM209-like [Mesoplodon densirostris]|uniref:LOW QUALITY PROTEIN: protein FAM209-like n=1 Tax=Mesoplodon densirostris TaxID=48708 RepID=UPI0028DB09D7|nr:LOW QUALITY PROTEIN: protein FAM209-like [Mesoplodon densirostris]